jgi:Transcriptional regulator PadR-like family
MKQTQTDLLQGTLDLLVLKTLQSGPTHGWDIAQRIQQVSQDVLQVGQGSLYPALHRLEAQGWIASEWGVGEQPEGEILQTDRRRPETIVGGDRNVETIHGCGRTDSEIVLNGRIWPCSKS